MIHWKASPCLSGGYLVTGVLHDERGTTTWVCFMSEEMYEDDWLPDVIARIERLLRQ